VAGLSSEDLEAFGLTLRLAATVTLLLILIGAPLAWWLARTNSGFQRLVAAVVALPLVLPPTVLGFYLLLLLGPQGAVGQLMSRLGLSLLPFTFGGLVVGSMLYSLPFVVQPLQNAFEAIGEERLEAAACLRAGPIDRFWSIAMPVAVPGIVTAAVLGFAHTVGEFGVVLMIGGNIPGVTQTLSISIFDLVEDGRYADANHVALLLIALSVAGLVLVYTRRPWRQLA